MVVTAMGDSGPHPSLNALFTKERAGDSPADSAEHLAAHLMRYAAGDPQRLGAGSAPLIVYDPYDAVHYFNTAMRTLALPPGGP